MKFPRLLTSLLQFLRIPAEKPAVKPDVNSLNIRNSFDHYEQEKQWDLYMPLSRNSLSIEPDIPQRPFIIATFDAQAYGIQRKTQYYGGLLRSSTAHVYCFQRISIVEFQWLSNNEEVGKKWVVLPIYFYDEARYRGLITLIRRNAAVRTTWNYYTYEDLKLYIYYTKIIINTKSIHIYNVHELKQDQSSRDSLRRMAALSRLYSQHGNDLVFFAGNAELPQEVVEPWDDVQAEHHSLFRNKVVPFGPVSWLRNFASVHLLDADEEDTTCPMDQYFGMHSRLKAGVQVEFRIPA